MTSKKHLPHQPRGFQKPWPANLDLFLLLLSTALSLEIFFLRWNFGLTLGDEGFFWYGVQAVLRGEIPMRDFRAYEPGRYYWGALWFHLWRPGLVPLRLSETVFKAMGLFLGLLAAKRMTANRWELSAAGLVLALWIFPDYKVFDCVMPMAGVYAGCRLLEDPRPLNFWIAGGAVSFAFLFGLNHALYLSLAFLALFFVLFRRGKAGWKEALFLAGGAFLALLPFLLWAFFTGGLWESNVTVLRQIFQSGTTNSSLPVPWPWIGFPPALEGWGFSNFLLGCLFLALPFFYLAWGYFIYRADPKSGPRLSLLLACVAVGIPYLHYAFSRADDQHLAAALSPFWLGFFIQTESPRGRRVFLALGITLSVFCIGARSGLNQLLFSGPVACNYQIGRDKISLDDNSIRLIEAAKAVSDRMGPGESLLIFPHLPALYAVLGMKAPIWDIYATTPISEAEQEKEIRDVEKNNVQWAILDDCRMDGSDAWRIETLQPLFWNYLQAHFEADPASKAKGCVSAYRRIRTPPSSN